MQSDAHLRQATYTAFCQEWLKHWGLQRINNTFIPEVLNSIGIIQTLSQIYIISLYPKELKDKHNNEVKALQLAGQTSKKQLFLFEATKLLEAKMDQEFLKTQTEEAQTRKNLQDKFNAKLAELAEQNEQPLAPVGVLTIPEYKSLPSSATSFLLPKTQANKRGSSENVSPDNASTDPDISDTSFKNSEAENVKVLPPSCSHFFRTLMQSPEDIMRSFVDLTQPLGSPDKLTQPPQTRGKLPQKGSSTSWDNIASPLAPPA